MHDGYQPIPTSQSALWCSWWLLGLQAKFTGDKRSVWVTTKANAPGGARTEKVGLPYDPELLDHMVEHGVIIEVQLLLPNQPATSSISMSEGGSCRGLVSAGLPCASCIPVLALPSYARLWTWHGGKRGDLFWGLPYTRDVCVRRRLGSTPMRGC